MDMAPFGLKEWLVTVSTVKNRAQIESNYYTVEQLWRDEFEEAVIKPDKK